MSGQSNSFTARGSGPRCVIVGGGVVGSSVACFLANREDFDGTVTVVESDPTYRSASTALSVGGIRHQFSTRENVLASLFATEFVRDPSRFVRTSRTTADLAFVENGYLMLATTIGEQTLRENTALQVSLGANIDLLDPCTTLADRFSWLNVGDLALAAHGRHGEGWIDPYSLLMLFRESAISRGARYVAARVSGFERQGDLVQTALLDNGETLRGDVFVNAAGPAAAEICELAFIERIPVRRRKRQVFVFHCRSQIPRCPLVVDPEGVYFRPEGEHFICGRSPARHEDPDCEDLKVDHDWFYDRIWPVLASRVKAFEAIKLTSAWAGHYAYNTFDQNAIVGLHPESRNFYLANGFSGHGLQQSPAVGRGIAELIIDGRFTSLDLSAFAPGRITDGCPLTERNIV